MVPKKKHKKWLLIVGSILILIIIITDLDNPADWQAGDIVVFNKHIAICSDIRNASGIPFILHHSPIGAREADDMDAYTIAAHYRWNGELN